MDASLHTDLNWNLLRVFYIVASEQSVTRAAKRLGLSQPSVSNGLRRLEDQLGRRLVIRDSRHFELTPCGTKILAECVQIFDSASRISAIVGADETGERGLVRYQIVSNLASPMLDEIMRLFHQRHRAVTFQGEIQNSQIIVRNILENRLNLGICLLAEPQPGLCALRLFREEFSLFCGAEHPLFGQRRVSIEDVESEPFVSFACATQGAGLEPMSTLLAGTRLGRHIIGLSTNMEEVRRMIVSGLGIGVLPLMTAQQDIRDGALWPLRITDEPIGADVYLVHAQPERLAPAERNFVAIVHELIALYPDMS
ncbi:LysR family transcriptional regulator [Roseovarius sp. D0-M9]|uniref:LysR family transcriptional regulator n=1 Tax=Roseovarius sp. D0-M9 TaxID=3127117 RepID=UPI00300FF8F7